jgi:hypothetical protein
LRLFMCALLLIGNETAAAFVHKTVDKARSH